MSTPALPYKIACLCDLRDDRGRVLMLRRTKAPNLGLFSPIGGKLDVALGESPAQCAVREIHEEAGIRVAMEHVRLIGMVSEQAYEGQVHWLMFVYRVVVPVDVPPRTISEGELCWIEPEQIDRLPLPESDRLVIWPLMRRVAPDRVAGEPGFFAVHIDCSSPTMAWTVEQLSNPAEATDPGERRSPGQSSVHDHARTAPRHV